MPMMFGGRGGRGRAMRYRVSLPLRNQNDTFVFLLGAGVDRTGMHRTEETTYTHTKQLYRNPIEYVYVNRYTVTCS